MAQVAASELAFEDIERREPVGARAVALTVAVYVALGSLLVWTRLVWLGRSLWYDEILTVTRYMRAGPREILTGPYLPNNHELYSLLGWATTSILGQSEVALRLWSSIPFLVGVIVVTAWLHVRVSALTAVFFLFFATVSPVLLDLSREARGYGLAFLAMSVLIVAGFEALRTGRISALIGFFAAGLVGTLTLPIFGVAFFATALVLLGQPAIRGRSALGLGLSILATVAWYAPHIDDLLENSSQHDGQPIPLWGLLISPIDQVLVPGMLWFGGTFLTTYPGRLLVIVALGVLLAYSPMIRERRTALLLGSGALTTLALIWATRLYLQPRFVSYLLVPLFIVLADGTAHAVRSVKRQHGVPALVAACTITFAIAAFIGAAAHLLRFPGEAWKDTAAVVNHSSRPSTPVLAYVSRPLSLGYYLDRPIHALKSPDVASKVCGSKKEVVYVTEPYDIEPVDVPCLRRDGVRHFRLVQHSRGGEINVWVVPPAA